jgi:hypothetical protein
MMGAGAEVLAGTCGAVGSCSSCGHASGPLASGPLALPARWPAVPPPGLLKFGPWIPKLRIPRRSPKTS